MKKIFAIVLVVMLALGACACAESATPKLDAIKEAGKIVMITNATFPPFESLDDAGNVVGVDADISQLIADKLGVELEIIDMDWTLLIEALKSGKGDFVAAGMTITEDRLKEVDFTIPYIAMGLKAMVPLDTDIVTYDDMADKKIAVQLGTTSDLYASEFYPDAEILAFNGTVEAGLAVVSGNADCAIIDLLPGTFIAQQYADKIKLMDGLVSEEETGIAVAKGDDDLAEFINGVLEEAMANGFIQQQFDLHMASFDIDAY